MVKGALVVGRVCNKGDRGDALMKGNVGQMSILEQLHENVAFRWKDHEAILQNEEPVGVGFAVHFTLI